VRGRCLEPALNGSDSAAVRSLGVRTELLCRRELAEHWPPSLAPWGTQSGGITGTLGICLPCCSSLAWSSRGSFHPHPSSSAAELLCFLSKWGISKFPYIDGPSKQKLLCGAEKSCVPKSLFVPAVVICLREDIASLQKLLIVYVPRLSRQLQLTPKPSHAQNAVPRVCAAHYMCRYVSVLAISQSKYGVLVAFTCVCFFFNWYFF